jgi:FG-GAP-like repeat
MQVDRAPGKFGLWIAMLLALRAEAASPCPAGFREHLRREEGKVESPLPWHIVYAFPAYLPEEHRFDLITTELPEDSKGGSGPRLRLIRWSPKNRLKEESEFPAIMTEHARDIRPFHWHEKNALVLADHGPDRPPFPGGIPRLLVEENEKWTEAPALLPPTRAFHFNVSPFTLGGQSTFLLFNAMATAGTGNYLLKSGKDGFHEVKLLPKEFRRPDHCFMTSRPLLPASKKNYIYLGGCDLPPGSATQAHDRVLEISGKQSQLLPEDTVPARALDPSWGTVNLLQVDLNNDGLPDLVAAVHNHGFSEGGLQIHLRKAGKKPAFEAAGPYLPLTLPGHSGFVSMVEAGDFFGDGYPALVATINYNASAGLRGHLPRFALLRNNHGRGFTDLGQCLGSKLPYVSYAAIRDFYGDGKPALFLLAYDGRYEIFRP